MAHAQTPNPQAQLASLNQHVAAALTAAHSGNLQRARSEYAAFDTGWFEIEDGIRDRSRQSYRDIETAMGDVKFALKQQPVDTAQLIAALEALDASNTAFIKGSVSSAGTPHGASEPTTFASALPKLDAALTALGGNDLAQASVEVEAFRAVWPDIEGVVAAKDGAIYQRAEALQAEASAALKAGQVQQATTTLQQLKAALAPFATEQRYGVFEATSILLREGLEALLIIAALLAFLQKAGHADKRRWIWIGGAAGIAASLLAAVAIQMLFSTFVNGANRELVEGITGLVAASLLFYVSYWLHSKTYLGGWHRYLKDKTNTALATGSLFSLAALAFLSVFREGAETTLFYIGIAPAIALRDLLLGLGIGTLLLVVLGVLIIGLGKRLPLAPFFRVTSLLIWYLGFKFIGSGIRALQIARAVPETTVSWLPSSDLLGLYPTWETTLPQLALLITAIVVVLWMRTSAKQMTRAGMTVNR
jgi:high-affinity iron transporter